MDAELFGLKSQMRQDTDKLASQEKDILSLQQSLEEARSQLVADGTWDLGAKEALGASEKTVSELENMRLQDRQHIAQLEERIKRHQMELLEVFGIKARNSSGAGGVVAGSDEDDVLKMNTTKCSLGSVTDGRAICC